MARKETVEAFNRWIADEENVAELLELIGNGRTLKDAAWAKRQPYTCVHAYFHSTRELEERLAKARKAWAAHAKDETISIADTCPTEPGAAARARLQIEARDGIAKAYDRELWGDKVQVERSGAVGVDAVLLKKVDDLLRLASEKVVGPGPGVVEIQKMLEHKEQE